MVALSFSGPINRSPMSIHSYIDSSATKAQRIGLRGIVETLFSAFNATLITSGYVPIKLDYDADSRKAEIPGILNLVTKPIRSPINPSAPVELHNVGGPSAPTVRLATGEVHTYRNEKDRGISWQYSGRNAYWGAYAYTASMFSELPKRPLYDAGRALTPHDYHHDHSSDRAG